MPNRDFSRVAEAIEYLCRMAAEQPNLGQLARRGGLSDGHFLRVFQRWAGISPKQFLQFLSLSRARELLLDAVTVMDASCAVGLSSPGRLHDLFIRFEGVAPGQYRRGGRGLTVHWGVLPTPLGPALFAGHADHLTGLTFLTGTEAGPALADLRRRWPEARLVEAPAPLEGFAAALDERLRGAPYTPLALTLRGTPFQLTVWEALLRIPPGQVVTYEGLGNQVGASAPAVGASLRRNPIACLIPCHRVICASGALGYYEWGSQRKEVLLALERGQAAAGLPFRPRAL